MIGLFRLLTFLCSATTSLDYTVHWTFKKSVDHLITLKFDPIMPALCWHNKNTYYAQSNASILCLSLDITLLHSYVHKQLQVQHMRSTSVKRALAMYNGALLLEQKWPRFTRMCRFSITQLILWRWSSTFRATANLKKASTSQAKSTIKTPNKN